MALYRNIQMAFWTDTNVADDYTPDDRLMYLYLLTNPHTNLAGCYEVSISQVSNETGFDRKKVDRLIERAETVHGTVIYSKATKEMLVLNWSKYNWTSSEKFRKPLLREIESVKDGEFRRFLMDLYNGNDTVSIPYAYGSDTTVTVTVPNIDTLAIKNNNDKAKKVDKAKVDINNKVDDSSLKTVKGIYYPNDEKLDQAFRDYVEMRKAIKAPMTDRAITLAMNKLATLAQIPFSDMMDNDLAVEILEQSVMNSWKGLFPLKEEKKGGNIIDEWRNAL